MKLNPRVSVFSSAQFSMPTNRPVVGFGSTTMNNQKSKCYCCASFQEREPHKIQQINLGPKLVETTQELQYCVYSVHCTILSSIRQQNTFSLKTTVPIFLSISGQALLELSVPFLGQTLLELSVPFLGQTFLELSFPFLTRHFQNFLFHFRSDISRTFCSIFFCVFFEMKANTEFSST